MKVFFDVEYKREDERGSLIQVNTGTWRQFNLLTIYKDKKFGGHYHKHKKELFYLLKGEIRIDILYVNTHKSESVLLKPHSNFLIIEPYESHTITANEDSTLIELLSNPYDKYDIYET